MCVYVYLHVTLLCLMSYNMHLSQLRDTILRDCEPRLPTGYEPRITTVYDRIPLTSRQTLGGLDTDPYSRRPDRGEHYLFLTKPTLHGLWCLGLGFGDLELTSYDVRDWAPTDLPRYYCWGISVCLTVFAVVPWSMFFLYAEEFKYWKKLGADYCYVTYLAVNWL